jgi:hypothetical protein
VTSGGWRAAEPTASSTWTTHRRCGTRWKHEQCGSNKQRSHCPPPPTRRARSLGAHAPLHSRGAATAPPPFQRRCPWTAVCLGGRTAPVRACPAARPAVALRAQAAPAQLTRFMASLPRRWTRNLCTRSSRALPPRTTRGSVHGTGSGTQRCLARVLLGSAAAPPHAVAVAQRWLIPAVYSLRMSTFGDFAANSAALASRSDYFW